MADEKDNEGINLENQTLELARQYGREDGKIAVREYLEKARYLESLDRYDGWLYD